MMLKYALLLSIGFLAIASGGWQAPARAMIAAGAVSPASIDATAAVLQGDVDCSNVVDIGDVVQLLKLQSSVPSAANCAYSAGNVDCAGGVTVVDALRILRFLANAPLPTPGGCSAINAIVVASPSSEALIAEALKRGNISYEDSLRYRALALYDLPGLPEEYRSPVVDYHAALGLFSEVGENHDSLSQGLLESMEPFMARPNDAASIFNNPPQRAPAAAAGPWLSASAAGGKLRVWVQESPVSEAALANYASEATRVWNALPGIFRYGLPDTPNLPSAVVNPDSAIDIYFVDAGELDPRMAGCNVAPPPPECAFQGAGGGYTGYENATAPQVSPSYIMIDSSVSGATLTSHIAHELVHTGQHAYDIHEPLWLKDATAAWGAVRVTQKLGVSLQPNFDYLPGFFDGLHLTLTRDTEDDLNRYGSWLYFFFASMVAGDGIVTTIWENAAAPGIQNEAAVDSVFPFREHFDDFTVRNWNQDSVDPKYENGNFTTAPRGDPTFPNLKPDVDVTKNFTTDEEHVIDETPVALSALYYKYTFAQPVRTLTFTNEVSDNPDAHLWVIKKVGTNWKPPEDWSRERKKKFCRDIPEEDLTEVIVILSNSHKTNNLPGGPKLKTKAETTGCNGWKGTATSTVTIAGGNYSGTLVSTADILWELHDQSTIHEPCDMVLDDSCLIYHPTGTITWQYEFSFTSGDFHCEDSSAGVFPANNVAAYYDQMLELAPDGHGGFRYAGHGLDPVDYYPRPCYYGGQGAIWYFEAPKQENFQIAGGANSFSGSYHTIGGFEDHTTFDFAWSFHEVGNATQPP